jgi:hypothetical protein
MATASMVLELRESLLLGGFIFFEMVLFLQRRFLMDVSAKVGQYQLVISQLAVFLKLEMDDKREMGDKQEMANRQV